MVKTYFVRFTKLYRVFSFVMITAKKWFIQNHKDDLLEVKMKNNELVCAVPPHTSWKIDSKKFVKISSSPIGSDIHQSFNNDKQQDIEFCLDNVNEQLVSKIAGFLNKNGCYLVTGFRGVGKSSVVNRAIKKYKKTKNNQDSKDSPVIVVAIPLEQSLDINTLVRIIFRNFLSKLVIYPVFIKNIGNMNPDSKTGIIDIKDKKNDSDEIKVIKKKLKDLYYGLEIHLENVHEPIPYMRPKEFEVSLKDRKAAATFYEGQKRYLSLKPTISQLIYELKDLVNLLTLDPFKIKCIFVFDELDRLKSQEEIIEDKERGKQDIYVVEMLVKELKALFNQAHANFIFIAGVDMYEKWQAEKSRGDGIYEGIFSENFYVSSLLTNTSNQEADLKIKENNNDLLESLNRQYLETYYPESCEYSTVKTENTENKHNNTDMIEKFILDILNPVFVTKKIPGTDIKCKFELKPGTRNYYSISQSNIKFTIKQNIDLGKLKCLLRKYQLNETINDITCCITEGLNKCINLREFHDKIIGIINSKTNCGKNVDTNEFFRELVEEVFPKDTEFTTDGIDDSKPSIMLKGFCRYLRFKSRGIFRKLIRELNDFIIIKGEETFLHIDNYNAQKIKFFSGVEKLIQDKMPAHYFQNDMNKVLLYFIIDSSFKFYKTGMNLEDWETFSILPDKEKVLIDKRIYNDALDILNGNYLEYSFGRKTILQFTPKYSRQIDHIIKKIPHEQHNFNISLLDFNAHLNDLLKQLKELNEGSSVCFISNQHITIQIARVYAKLNNPIRAMNSYKNAIKVGTEELEKIIQNKESLYFRLHRITTILDQICECYIEIGLLEFEVRNNKKSISHLWSGVKMFLDFYEWLIKASAIKYFNQEGNITDAQDCAPLDFYPFSQENKSNIIGFIEKFLDYLFYVRECTSKELVEERVKSYQCAKKAFLNEFNTEKTPRDFFVILDENKFKELLYEKFGTFFDQVIAENEKTNEKKKDAFNFEFENALIATGFDPKTTFDGKGKLGYFHSYLIVLYQKLRKKNLPEFFSPKLLNCVNTLSTFYSRMGQFELSAQLLISGLVIADNTSFHSNAIIQRMQLALFYLLRFEFVKSLQYYQATLRYVNVQRRYMQSKYYMSNALLAGLFDMIGVFESIFSPVSYGLTNKKDRDLKTLEKHVRDNIHLLFSYSAQTYYLKEQNERKSISSKLKLAKALVYQGVSELYLACKSESESNNEISMQDIRQTCFFTIIKEAIHLCKDILSMSHSGNVSLPKEEVKFTIVRNTGEALFQLGEIALIIGRVNKLCTVNKLTEKKQEMNELNRMLESIWNDIGQILKAEYSILETIVNIEETRFYVFAEQFLRVAERFLTSFYMPESINIPIRLGMTFYFVSKIPTEKKDELLKIAEMYMKKAIKGFTEYQDYERSGEEWIGSAHSDIGNIYYEIYKNTNNDNEKIRLAIKHFKKSLEYFTVRMNDLFATLTGKEPTLRVSLDSLVDTDYCFYLFQKLSRRMTSLHWKNENYPQNLNDERCTNSTQKGKGFKELMKGKYGFFTDTSLIHDIAKYLKQCLYGTKWDISLETNQNNIEEILAETRYLSNIFRNHGGIEDEKEIETLTRYFQEKYKTNQIDPFYIMLVEIGSLNEENKSKQDDKNKLSQKIDELRMESWPIGGYQFVVNDDDSILEGITNFTKEYSEFRGLLFDETRKKKL